MNRHYRDNMLEILPVLETVRNVTMPKLVSLHPAGLSLRTLQRYVNEFAAFGLELQGERRGELRIRPEAYLSGLSRFIKVMLADRVHPPVHGEISEKLILEALTPHAFPAKLVADILKAVRESRILNFAYKPQHPETRRKLAAAKTQRGHGIIKNGHMPVSLVPCGFSFGGDLMLLVGESRYADGKIERRQYALRGMSALRLGEPTKVQLTFDFSEIYADSVYTWLGGEHYLLQIEDRRFDEEPRHYELRANGEEEVLAFASSALGRVRIINPPDKLVQKAADLGIDSKLIFSRSA
jgi:hypothetical protein